MKNNPAVIMYPSPPINPYHKLLAKGLKDIGFMVKLEPMQHKKFPTHLLKISRYSDILHIHWISHLYSSNNRIKFILRTFFLLFLFIILKLKKKTLIITVHNLIPHDSNYSNYHIFAKRILIKLFDDCIVHSSTAKTIVENYLKPLKPCKVIPHGNYRNYYGSNISKAHARSKLKIPGDAIVLLYFGAIKPYKGLAELIESFNSNRYDKRILLIAGRGDRSYINRLKNISCKNIIFFTKLIKDHEVKHFMRSSDCMVLPYRDGLTSGTAILGLSFKLPLISSYCPAFEEFHQKNLNHMCEISDPQSLNKAIENVLSWDPYYHSINCDHFLDETGWDKVAYMHFQIYADHIRKQKKNLF